MRISADVRLFLLQKIKFEENLWILFESWLRVSETQKVNACQECKWRKAIELKQTIIYLNKINQPWKREAEEDFLAQFERLVSMVNVARSTPQDKLIFFQIYQCIYEIFDKLRN